jgi:hypothetical protein
MKEFVVIKRFSIVPATYKSLSRILLSRLNPFTEKIIGKIITVFENLLIKHSAFVKYLRKMEQNEAVRKPILDFKKNYD